MRRPQWLVGSVVVAMGLAVGACGGPTAAQAAGAAYGDCYAVAVGFTTGALQQSPSDASPSPQLAGASKYHQLAVDLAALHGALASGSPTWAGDLKAVLNDCMADGDTAALNPTSSGS